MRVNLDGVCGEISTLPGNSNVAVSHAVFVPASMRGKGLGTKAQEKRLELMKNLGYDYVLCTVRQDNSAQIHVLLKFGWRELSSFASSRSEGLILIFGRTL